MVLLFQIEFLYKQTLHILYILGLYFGFAFKHKNCILIESQVAVLLLVMLDMQLNAVPLNP